MESEISNHLDTMSEMEFKQKLVEFFERHDSNGLRTIDEITAKYSDRKAEVFAHLTNKYAPEGAGETTASAGGPSMGSNTGSLPWQW